MPFPLKDGTFDSYSNPFAFFSLDLGVREAVLVSVVLPPPCPACSCTAHQDAWSHPSCSSLGQGCWEAPGDAGGSSEQSPGCIQLSWVCTWTQRLQHLPQGIFTIPCADHTMARWDPGVILFRASSWTQRPLWVSSNISMILCLFLFMCHPLPEEGKPGQRTAVLFFSPCFLEMFTPKAMKKL